MSLFPQKGGFSSDDDASSEQRAFLEGTAVTGEPLGAAVGEGNVL